MLKTMQLVFNVEVYVQLTSYLFLPPPHSPFFFMRVKCFSFEIQNVFRFFPYFSWYVSCIYAGLICTSSFIQPRFSFMLPSRLPLFILIYVQAFNSMMFDVLSPATTVTRVPRIHFHPLFFLLCIHSVSQCLSQNLVFCCQFCS